MRRKNYILFSAALLILFSGIIFAGATLKYIQAYNQSEKIIVEWQTQTETDVKSFVIERKTPNGSFVSVGTLTPTGDFSFYRFEDDAVYKTTEKLYTYRLAIVDKNNSISHSMEISVTLGPVSSVKRTWGSIKALFR